MPTQSLLAYGLTVWLLSLGILTPALSVAAAASLAQTPKTTTHSLTHKVKKPTHKNVAQPEDGALVQNIRVKDYSDYTRLVLDRPTDDLYPVPGRRARTGRSWNCKTPGSASACGPSSAAGNCRAKSPSLNRTTIL